MNEKSFDIIIVGGGIVGCALALALSHLSLKIVLLEAAPAISEKRLDERAIALTYASIRFLESLNVWENILPHATPIQKVHVSEAGCFGRVMFSASDMGYPFLGQVVFAHHLLNGLRKKISNNKDISIFYDSNIKKIIREERGYSLEVEDLEKRETFSARLLVAADGAQSLTRSLLNLPVISKDYHQHAIVATVKFSKPHAGVAYERFAAPGVLAALPTASADSYVIIWTVPQSEIASFAALSDHAFSDRLQSFWGYRLGRVLSVQHRQAFPLHAVFAQTQVIPFAMLIGNAAHSLHPVAAQGLNLSLKDIAVFSELVSDAMACGEDPLRYALLEAYAEGREKEQKQLSYLTDGLLRLFCSENPCVVMGRNLGLCALSLLPPMQKVISKKSMGVFGKLPISMCH